MTDTPAPYGYCPVCGGLGRSRERRPNGDDRCKNGHVYPSSQALKTTLQGQDSPSLEDAYRRLSVKYEQLVDHLLAIERNNVNQWKEGYTVAERQIKAWLRDLGSRTHDEDGIPYNQDAAKTLLATVNAIEQGEHRPSKSSELDALLARVEQGARATERDKIVAWLRTAPCDSPGHDPRWCQDCQVRERAADAIDCGVHRK